MKKIVIATFIILSLPGIVLAQDISVDELLGGDEEVKAEISQNIEEVEQERQENIENELNLSIPEYTDNPRQIVTFSNPSEEGAVELDIDESGYKEISSPYSLPSLRIGEHRLKFRFVDSIGATKVLDYDIIIIPRPPVLKAPTFEGNDIILSGTGLANSEVLLTVSVGAYNDKQIADIDGEGNWNTSITLDTASNGIYTVFAYTRKDGYASNPSEPAVMEYGNAVVVDEPSENKDISFNFNSIELEDLPSIILQSPDLLITVISALLLGAFIASLIFLLTRRETQRKSERDVSKKINGKKKEEKTLMELFGEEEKSKGKKDNKSKSKKKEKKQKKVENENKTEDKGEEKETKEEKEQKIKERTFTKRDFLKDFKKFDPDNEKGEEKETPPLKEKKDLIVTLTSKIED